VALLDGSAGQLRMRRRARYAEMLDGVINDREEVVITRAGHEPGSRP
jgi:hypothetical protein